MPVDSYSVLNELIVCLFAFIYNSVCEVCLFLIFISMYFFETEKVCNWESGISALKSIKCRFHFLYVYKHYHHGYKHLSFD